MPPCVFAMSQIDLPALETEVEKMAARAERDKAIWNSFGIPRTGTGYQELETGTGYQDFETSTGYQELETEDSKRKARAERKIGSVPHGIPRSRDAKKKETDEAAKKKKAVAAEAAKKKADAAKKKAEHDNDVAPENDTSAE